MTTNCDFKITAVTKSGKRKDIHGSLFNESMSDLAIIDNTIKQSLPNDEELDYIELRIKKLDITED